MLVDLVPGSEHATIILRPRPGSEIIGASSDEALAVVAVARSWHPEATPPALDALDHFANNDLTRARLWPAVADDLYARGIGAVVAQRIVADDRRLGLLLLGAREPDALDDVDRARLETFAALIAGWVLAEEQGRRIAHLERALDGARTIGRAMGLVMAERNMLSDEAAEHLKVMSMSANVKVRDLATGLLSAHERTVETHRD